MTKCFAILHLLFLFVLTHLHGGVPLKIDLICYRNGVGLNRDIDLLSEELTKLGHYVRFIDSNDHTPKAKADINVFLDVVEEFFFPYAERNFLIPNPEWCLLTPIQIAQFDLILCKTREAERIFKPLNAHTVYMSFSGKDRFDETVSKNYRLPLHVAGASLQKGTKALVTTWMANPQFPSLLLLRHKAHFPFPQTPNILLVSDYLSDKALRNLQNSYGLHLCPSETEGFGHYIIEAMSSGAVVITTDAAPMNELVSDKRCLVKYSSTTPWRLANSYFVDPVHLDLVISNVLSMPEEELREIGRKNREFYLKNHEFFKTQLAKFFDSDYVFALEKKAWEMTDYVWNLGISCQSDIGMDRDPFHFFSRYYEKKISKEDFKSVKQGDVAWIRCKEIPIFYKEILPELTQPIVLVISDGDESFPSAIAQAIDVDAFLNCDKILHVFAQNCDYRGSSPKVSHLPIGIDFHTCAYRASFWGETGSPKDQESVLKEILSELQPTYLRKPRAYVNFQLSDSIRDCGRLEFGEDRTTIFNRLLPTNLIDYGQKMRRSDLWKTKGQYAFSISPHGNGLDCHRTWEDLALGCIVIVKTSPLDPLYEGLPVVIVKDWSEVTEANLKIWLERYKDAFTNTSYRERLTNKYWLNKIRFHSSRD